jgi:uncharacterized RDD family membrane protein YckC
MSERVDEGGGGVAAPGPARPVSAGVNGESPSSAASDGVPGDGVPSDGVAVPSFAPPGGHPSAGYPAPGYPVPQAPSGGPYVQAYPQAPAQPYPQPYPQAYPQTYPRYAYPPAGVASGVPFPVAPLPPLADWGPRAGAFLIDGLISGWPMMISVVVLFATMETRQGTYGGTRTEWLAPSAAGWLAYVLGYLAQLAISLWNRTFRQGRTGQSIGKKVLGIRMVAEVGLQPVGPLNSFLRDLVHTVDGFAYVGYLWPLWDAKRQTFADKIMKTVVVRD